MTNYVLDYAKYHSFGVQGDAAVKPLVDMTAICEGLGFTTLAGQRFGAWDKHVNAEIVNTLKPGDVIVQASPSYTSGMDSERTVLAGARYKGAKIIGVVNDIDNFRFNYSPDNNWIEKMNMYDAIIVQSLEMRSVLRGYGLSMGKMVVMNGPWPYMSSERLVKPEFKNHLTFAGNVTRDKASFLKQLTTLIELPVYKEIQLHVPYAKYRNEEQVKEYEELGIEESENVTKYLLSNHNILPLHLSNIGGFGLVLDGGTDTDGAKAYSNYTKYVWPHKLSAYLAAGLPVITTESQHCAEYVKARQLGLVVPNVQAIPHAIKEMTVAEYNIYVGNVAKEIYNIRAGFYLSVALVDALGRV